MPSDGSRRAGSGPEAVSGGTARGGADGPAPTGSASGVAVLAWPAQAGERARLAALGLPRLLVVAAHATAPGPEGAAGDGLEDWLREPVDPRELAARAATVAQRHGRARAPQIDEAGRLRMGDRWVDVPAQQVGLVRHLLDHVDEVVPTAELAQVAAFCGLSDRPDALKTTLRRLDVRLGRVGLRLHRIRGQGHLLEVVGPHPGPLR